MKLASAVVGTGMHSTSSFGAFILAECRPWYGSAASSDTYLMRRAQEEEKGEKR